MHLIFLQHSTIGRLARIEGCMKSAISNKQYHIPDQSEMGSGCNSCQAKSLQFFQLNQMHPFSSIKTGGCQQLTFTEGQHVLIVLSFSVCILS